jgi:hypothetical protein
MDVDHSDRPAGPFQPTWIVLGAAYGLTVVTVSADPGQRSAVAGLVLALVVAVVVFPGDRRPGGRLVGGGLVMLSGTAVVLLGAVIVGWIGNGVGAFVVCFGAAVGLKGLAVRHGTTQRGAADWGFALAALGLAVAAVRDDAVASTLLVLWIWWVLSRRGAALRRNQPPVRPGAT